MNILYHHIMLLFYKSFCCFFCEQQLKINNFTAQHIFLLTKFYKLQNLCIYVLEKNYLMVMFATKAQFI